MPDMLPCPLCLRPARWEDRKSERAKFALQCFTCGRYSFAPSLVDKFGSLRADPKTGKLLAGLSAATRQAEARGEILSIGTKTWLEVARSHAYTPIAVKKRNFLELLRERSTELGSPVLFLRSVDWPLINAASATECYVIVSTLLDEQLIHLPANSDGNTFSLTSKGWEVLEPLVMGVPGLCFVAMSFDPSLETAFEEGIRPAVEVDCGFTAYRVDRAHFSEQISVRILADIRRSQFLIADFTQQKKGVYFEAGFAMALGREVIWSCRENDLANLHFDTRQFPHVVWREPQDLRIGLRDKIQALIPGAKLT